MSEFESAWFLGVRFRLACGGGVLSLVWCALRVIGPGVAEGDGGFNARD